MIRYTLLAAALVLTAASASAEEVSDYDRFRLWNDCRPMKLVVGLADDAPEIGLTEEAIETTVRSRLRAARLYSDSAIEKAGSILYFNPTRAILYIRVTVAGSAFIVDVGYHKIVTDRATELELRAETWAVSSLVVNHWQTGTNFILSALARHTDEFIDKYLRVNADACK